MDVIHEAGPGRVGLDEQLVPALRPVHAVRRGVVGHVEPDFLGRSGCKPRREAQRRGAKNRRQ